MPRIPALADLLAEYEDAMTELQRAGLDVAMARRRERLAADRVAAAAAGLRANGVPLGRAPVPRSGRTSSR